MRRLEWKDRSFVVEDTDREATLKSCVSLGHMDQDIPSLKVGSSETLGGRNPDGQPSQRPALTAPRSWPDHAALSSTLTPLHGDYFCSVL